MHTTFKVMLRTASLRPLQGSMTSKSLFWFSLGSILLPQCNKELRRWGPPKENLGEKITMKSEGKGSKQES
jgi:hypothetical protein